VTGSLVKLGDPRHRRAAAGVFVVRRLLRRPVVLRHRNGFDLIVHPDEPIYNLFYHGYLGAPEIGEQEFCKRVVRPGMTVVDVGANIGQYALLFAALVGPAGAVHAFEPCAATLRRLRANLALNGVEHVTTERLALSSIDGGILSLNLYPDGYSAWNTAGRPVMFSRDRPAERVEPIGREEVPTATLDAWASRHRVARIDFLKIDVEGAETDVLRGAAQLLAAGRIACVQFEVSRQMVAGMGRAAPDPFDLLRGFGYRCHPVSPAGELLPPVASTDAFLANFIALRDETGLGTGTGRPAAGAG
jgi:FkbM family methyltransferase